MIVGSYGDVAFEVSQDTVRTVKGLKWSRGAAYSQHKVHGMTAVPEFTGYDSATITFEVQLSAFLGLNPLKELARLDEMRTSKKAYALAFGEDLYGTLWMLQRMDVTTEYTYKDGTLASCKVALTLLERGDHP